MKSILISLCFMGLVGCSSPPAYHYTLSAPSSQAVASTTQPIGPYALGAVTVPSEVDSASLVTLEPNGRLLLLSDDRWTAPLSSHLQTALGLELTAQLGMPPLQNINQFDTQSNVTKILIDVQRFDLVPGQYVALDAVWRFRATGSHKVLTCFSRFRQTVDVGVTALVLGQQKNTKLLAAQIAQALGSDSAPSDSKCTRT